MKQLWILLHKHVISPLAVFLSVLPPPHLAAAPLRFFEDLKDMLGFTPYLFYYYMWKYITPILLLVLLGSSFVQLIMTPPSYSAWIQEAVGDSLWFLSLLGMEFNGGGGFPARVSTKRSKQWCNSWKQKDQSSRVFTLQTIHCKVYHRDYLSSFLLEDSEPNGTKCASVSSLICLTSVTLPSSPKEAIKLTCSRANL